MGTSTDIKPSQPNIPDSELSQRLRGFLKNSIPKAFFQKRLFGISVKTIVGVLLVTYSFPAYAGIFSFSSILQFLTGGDDAGAKKDLFGAQQFAAVYLPLLGSITGVSPIVADGVGGPPDESVKPPLSITHDSALVALQNPAGTLPSPHQDQIVIYTVQEGDAPSRIAHDFGISLNTLLWANSIRNPDLIKVGDELIILPVTGVQYEVKKGDTIESIAKEFKGDAGEIMSFNGIAVGELLVAESVIIVPDGERASVSPPVRRVPTSGSIGLPDYRGYYLRPILGGRKSRGFHGYNAVDLAQTCDYPVLASAEGTIIIVRASGWNGGYGNYAVIRHPNGTQTLYAHLGRILGSLGQYVAQGSQVATVGSTGNSTGCHVHFEVRGAQNPF